MSVYLIGDVQGCYKSLQRLLDALQFDRARDRLLFVGDLVNRGPRSLQVLRWVREHDDCCVAVLGNHDVHLLAAAIGSRKPKGLDTLDQVLRAPDRQELIDWLRGRPLLHEDDDLVMVHAGLHPRWSLKKARSLAGEVESMLRGDDWAKRLAQCYRHKPAKDWHGKLEGAERLASILSVLVSIRSCTEDGDMNRKYAGRAEDVPQGYVPWFDVGEPRWAGQRIGFGHWSTLGLRVTDDYIATDTGCVWGGKLTAVRVNDGAVVQVPCADDEHIPPR